MLARPINPVLSRELTQRMRGPRAMILLSIYLGLLSLVIVLVYRAETGDSASQFGTTPVTEISRVGQGLFEWTLLFTMVLVLFLVPGFTAGSIAGERERQTLLPMQVSLLRPISIVTGKIAASVMFTLVLVVATLPLLTVSYLIGGVTLRELLSGLGIVMFTAVCLAAISVAISTFMKRVQTATVVAYGLVLLIAAGSFGAFAIARQIDESRGFDIADPPDWIVAPSPVAALADLTGNPPRSPFTDFGPFGYSDSGDAPLTGIRDLLTPDFFGGDVIFEGDFRPVEDALAQPAFGGGFDQFGRPIPAGTDDRLPLWSQHMMIFGGLAAVSVVASARRLRTPAKTER